MARGDKRLAVAADVLHFYALRKAPWGEELNLWEVFHEDCEDYKFLLRATRLHLVKHHFSANGWALTAHSEPYIDKLWSHVYRELVDVSSIEVSEDLFDEKQTTFKATDRASYSLLLGGGRDRLSNSAARWGLSLDWTDVLQHGAIADAPADYKDPVPRRKRMLSVVVIPDDNGEDEDQSQTQPQTQSSSPVPLAAPAVSRTPLHDAYQGNVLPSWWDIPSSSSDTLVTEFELRMQDYDGSTKDVDPTMLAEMQRPLAMAFHLLRPDVFTFERYNDASGTKSYGSTVKYSVDLAPVSGTNFFTGPVNLFQKNTVTGSEMVLEVTRSAAFCSGKKQKLDQDKSFESHTGGVDLEYSDYDLGWEYESKWEPKAKCFGLDKGLSSHLHFKHLVSSNPFFNFSLVDASPIETDQVDIAFAKSSVAPMKTFRIQNSGLARHFEADLKLVQTLAEEMTNSGHDFDNLEVKTHLMWHGIRDNQNNDEAFGTLVNILTGGFNQMYHCSRSNTQAAMGHGIYFSTNIQYQLSHMPTFCSARLPKAVDSKERRFLVGCLVHTLTWSYADYGVTNPFEMEHVADVKTGAPTRFKHIGRSDAHWPKIGMRYVTSQEHAMPLFLVLL